MNKIPINYMAVLNRETLGKNHTFKVIRYLDTGSITKNEITDFQVLDVGDDEIPSRAQRRVKDKTIVYSTVRPRLQHHGILNNPSDNFIVSTGFVTIDANEEKINPYYLYYQLVKPESVEYLAAIADTAVSSYPSINPDDLGRMEVNLLGDVEYQTRVVKVLLSIDRKIELNNKINSELEAMAKTIYEYWFLQFDFPNEEGKPYRSSGGKMVWNEQLKREIPDGWEVKPILEWIKSDKRGDWGKDSIEGNYQLEVLCIRGTDLNGLNGKGELNAPTRYILKKNAEKLLESHDLIVEISGGSPTQSTGRLGLVTEKTLERFSTPIICSNFCKAFALKEKKLLFNFVYQWNNLYECGVLFGWEGKTSGIKNLLYENFVSGYKMPFPPSELVSRFYDYAKSIHDKIQKTLIENQELVQIRDWLLPMLMNGQVTVEERAAGN